MRTAENKIKSFSPEVSVSAIDAMLREEVFRISANDACQRNREIYSSGEFTGFAHGIINRTKDLIGRLINLIFCKTARFFI